MIRLRALPDGRAERALLNGIPVHSRYCVQFVWSSVSINSSRLKRVVCVSHMYMHPLTAASLRSETINRELPRLIRSMHSTEVVDDFTAQLDCLAMESHLRYQWSPNSSLLWLQIISGENKFWQKKAASVHSRPYSPWQRWTETDHIVTGCQWCRSTEDCHLF